MIAKRPGILITHTVLIVAILAAISATPATAAEKAIWGPTVLPDGRSAFPLYEELGVDTLQLTISWDVTAPTRPSSPQDPADPAYLWPAQIDAAMDEARRHGIAVALLVTQAPAWSNGGRSRIWAPMRPVDFADFLTAAARRYSGVRRWMIWGEPNKGDRFRPNRAGHPDAPRAYAKLLDAAYVALKRESSLNKVIGGMTWTGGTVKPADFARWMRLGNGRRPRLDWFGHNPFPFRFPDLSKRPVSGFRDISDLDTLGREVNRALGRAGHRRVPLWLSEFTVQTDRASSGFATFVTPAVQARYLTAAFRIADSLGTGVAGLGWHTLIDEAPAPPTSANMGVMTYALARKPSFAALARAPSRRRRPSVSAPSRIARGALRTSGVTVVLTARAEGRISVELRHGARLLDRASVRATAGSPRTVRLHPSTTRAGRYRLIVRASRAETTRRNLRVR